MFPSRSWSWEREGRQALDERLPWKSRLLHQQPVQGEGQGGGYMVALARRAAIPLRRTALICHRMKRPGKPQENMNSTVASTATAQNQRDVPFWGG